MLNLEGRILAVHPALHCTANDKGRTARAMVSARTVVTDATPKLGEDEEHDIVFTAMFLQVIHEGSDRAGNLIPELGVRGQFAGMRIKAAVLRVVNACAKIGAQHL